MYSLFTLCIAACEYSFWVYAKKLLKLIELILKTRYQFCN